MYYNCITYHTAAPARPGGAARGPGSGLLAMGAGFPLLAPASGLENIPFRLFRAYMGLCKNSVSLFIGFCALRGVWKASGDRFLLRPVVVPRRSDAATSSGKPPRFDPSNFQPLGPLWVRAVTVFVKAHENGPAHFRCTTIFAYAHAGPCAGPHMAAGHLSRWGQSFHIVHHAFLGSQGLL